MAMKLIKIKKQNIKDEKIKVARMSKKERKFRDADIQGDRTLQELCTDPVEPVKDPFKEFFLAQQKDMVKLVVKEIGRIFNTKEFKDELKKELFRKT